MTHRRNKTLLLRAILPLILPLTWPLFCSAAMPDHLYRDALDAAQQKATRNAQISIHRNSAERLSSSTIKLFLGRYYHLGDSWDVISWQFNRPLTPLKKDLFSAEENDLIQIGAATSLHYEITELKNGFIPQATLTVTQQNKFDLPLVDPRVKRLNLVFSDQFEQTQKTYFFENLKSGIDVSPDGVRSRMTPLEQYPIDVPNLTNVTRETRIDIPVLPQKIRPLAEKIKFNPDLSKCGWYEQDDFFGRPIQVLWQSGDPWPSYIKTSQGISLLVKSE